MIEESKNYMIIKEPQMASPCPQKMVVFGFEERRNSTDNCHERDLKTWSSPSRVLFQALNFEAQWLVAIHLPNEKCQCTHIKITNKNTEEENCNILNISSKSWLNLAGNQCACHTFVIPGDSQKFCAMISHDHKTNESNRHFPS